MILSLFFRQMSDSRCFVHQLSDSRYILLSFFFYWSNNTHCMLPSSVSPFFHRSIDPPFFSSVSFPLPFFLILMLPQNNSLLTDSSREHVFLSDDSTSLPGLPGLNVFAIGIEVLFNVCSIHCIWW